MLCTRPELLWKKASSPAAVSLDWRARANVRDLKGDNPDQDAGIKIVMRAVEEPLRQIVANAGHESSVVLNKVVEGTGNFGYNAATDEYGDLVEMGGAGPHESHALSAAECCFGRIVDAHHRRDGGRRAERTIRG